MSTVLIRPAATVTVGGVVAPATSGEVALDESWAPYCQGTVAVPFDDPAAVTGIDPRLGHRALIAASADAGAAPRTFDLGIRRRDIDYEAGVATLTLASDEALLQDYAPLANDKTPRTYETSLRAVCNYVLGKVIPGAALAASPSTDANVTAYWSVTNEFTNPGIEVDTTGWSIHAGANTPTRDTTQKHSGTASIKWTSTVASGETALRYTTIGVMPGHLYALSGWVFQDTSRAFRLRVRWKNDAGVTVRDNGIAPITPAASTWARISAIFVPPPGATSAEIHAASTPSAVGQATYLDDVMWHEGSEVVPYFDGSTPAGGGYTYAWSSTANASPSTRTPNTERDPEALTWKAGVTAWDFLEPLLTSTGLRLFCDEARVWRLVPATYSLPGVVALVAPRTTSAIDTISRDPDSPWANGVVARYLWDDALLGPMEKIDTAGTAGKVLVVEYFRPYPGPGGAAAILTAISARGRTQEVVALADYLATPGMESRITVESGVLVGRIRSLSWDLSTGLMQVASRDQAALTNGMIDMLAGTIDALVGTIDSLTPA